MKKLLILFSLLFSSPFCFAKTGFYSASFDPPKTDDINLARSSFQQFDLDQLILMVDRLAPEMGGYDFSASERVEMLKAELEDLGDRVQIVIEPWSGKERYLELYDADDLLILKKQGETLKKIHATIEKILQSQNLFKEMPLSMISLKKALHKESFQAFLREISLIFPNESLNEVPLPPFKPWMSNLGRVDQFIYSVIREKYVNQEKADDFGKKAQKLLISNDRNKPYAKLHCLNRVVCEPTLSAAASATPFLLPSVPKDQKHTLDIEIYCSDRFPKALFRSGLFQENNTYFHLGSTEEAIAYHRAEGFTEVFEVCSQAVRKLRTYHLLKKPNTSEIRFIVSHLHGEDTLQHVGYQLNTVAKWKKINLVRHETPSLLFTVQPNCRSFVFGSQDTCVIGFKNAISRLIEKNPEWKKTIFSETGLPIDLYENKRSKERIIVSKCVYGDQLLELLDFFYAKGVRKFQYFGTSGSLSSGIHVGDAIIPLAFVTPQNPFLPFNNQVVKILKNTNSERIKQVHLHGWAQSPVQETEEFLKKLQAQGIESIDVEARYYGEFFHRHPDASASMVLFVSDESFGSITLDHFNTMDHYVDDSFDHVIDALNLF